MALTLRLQNSGALPGTQSPVTMSGGVLTIGRGEDNDLALPDPERTLSKRHCVLEVREDTHFLIDVSTNGTYLNYGTERLGSTPTPLSNGDVVHVGQYELVVEIAAATDVISPLPPLPETAPAMANVPSYGEVPTSLDDSGDDDFLDALLGGRDQGASWAKPATKYVPLDNDHSHLPAMGAVGASVPDHSPAPQDSFDTRPQHGAMIPEDWDTLAVDEKKHGANEPATVSATVPSAPAQSQPDLLSAFLEGAGASHLPIPEPERAETMARLGQAFAAITAGVREILLTRASFKSEQRVQQTMVNVGGNNPLKFSISPEQAVEAMIRPTVSGYQDSARALAEALDDIKAHEIALMTGLEAALKDQLAQLDPANISKSASGDIGLGGLVKGSKARCWDAFERAHADITEQSKGEGESAFGQAFTRAYQSQLERLKSQ